MGQSGHCTGKGWVSRDIVQVKGGSVGRGGGWKGQGGEVHYQKYQVPLYGRYSLSVCSGLCYSLCEHCSGGGWMGWYPPPQPAGTPSVCLY